jgi:hypothetical protein
MNSPRKRTPWLGAAARKVTNSLGKLRKSPLPSNLDVRCCIACGDPVTKANLGGWSGRGALSGILWCEKCADNPRAIKPSFEPRHASIVNDALWIIFTVAELSRTPENKDSALRLRSLGRKLKHEANQLAFTLSRRTRTP